MADAPRTALAHAPSMSPTHFLEARLHAAA